MDDMTRAEIRLDNAEAAIRELQSKVYALEQELLGRPLRKINRLRLEYEEEWHQWWVANPDPDSKFPSFEKWLARRRAA